MVAKCEFELYQLCNSFTELLCALKSSFTVSVVRLQSLTFYVWFWTDSQRTFRQPNKHMPLGELELILLGSG